LAGIFYARIADNVSNAGVAISNPVGHLLGNRSAATGSNAIQQYQNAAPFTAITSDSAAIPSANFTILKIAPNLNADQSHQLAMVSVGSSLSSSQVTAFYNRLRTYMTAVGVP